MAGIGFKLRELLTSDSQLSRIKGAGASFMIAGGPMILMMAGLLIFQESWFYSTTRATPNAGFVGTVVYSYIIAWLCVGTCEVALSRYFADLVYISYLHTVPRLISNSILGCVFFCWISSFISADILNLREPFRSYMILLSCVYGAVNAASIFVMATRSYFVIIMGYFSGILTGVFLRWILARFALTGYAVDLLAWTSGQAVLLFFLVFALHREFGLWYESPPRPIKYLLARKKYILLGFLTALATVIDKFTFWISPHTSTRIEGSFLSSPDYDIGIFFAGITTLPGLTFFLVKIETAFHTAIRDEFNAVEQNATYEEISGKARTLNILATRSILQILFFQLTLAVFVIAVSKLGLFQFLNFKSRATFMWGVLGFSFFLPMVFANIFMLYFARVWEVIRVYFFFIILNLGLSLVSTFKSSSFYGSGFCIASIIGFIFSLQKLILVLENHTITAFTDIDDVGDILPGQLNATQIGDLEQ